MATEELNNQVIEMLEKANKEIERELNIPVLEKCNHVVVSEDLYYFINNDGQGFATVGFLTCYDVALRFTKNAAESIASRFKAENGNGPIIWKVMGVCDYLKRLHKKNSELLEISRKYASK